MSGPLYIEIGPRTLKILKDEEGLELPLERMPNGPLTEASVENVSAGLQAFLKKNARQPRWNAWCAIGARGVSLRRLELPSVKKEEFKRLLLLQIEREFPLAPQDLAWGFQLLGPGRHNGAAKQDVLVGAVRRDVIDQYSTMLARCGVNAAFTLSAIARTGAAGRLEGTYAILEVDGRNSEVALFEEGIPTATRSVLLDEDGATVEELSRLSGLTSAGNGAGRLFLTGPEPACRRLMDSFSSSGDARLHLERLHVSPGPGRSAAVLGLKRIVEENPSRLLLIETGQATGPSSRPSTRAPVKWAVAGFAILAFLMMLPYAEAFLFKGALSRRVSQVKADSSRLAVIDRQLDFLQYLKQNQPPYLDALYLFSKSAPAGSRIESLTVNRRGEVSLRGSMRNSDQVAEFRTKLVDSGFFSSVAVEEQTPTPDRQKVNVRIAAQWKPMNVLQTLAIGPTAEEIEKAKSAPNPGGGPMGLPPGAVSPGGIPMGVPPGVVIPGQAAPVASSGARSGLPMPTAPGPAPVRKEGD